MRYLDLLEMIEKPWQFEAPESAAEALRREKRWAAPAYAHARSAECLFYADSEGEAFWDEVEDRLLDGEIPPVVSR